MRTYKQKLKEKAPKIVKSVLTGIYPHAQTFGIMTAENPMGVLQKREKNKKLNRNFREELKRGYYQFVPIKGKFGYVENPSLIINIPLKILLHYGNLYNQESVIYGTIEKYGKVKFEYWERKSINQPLVKKDEVDYFNTIDNPDDFYSYIKNWKFSIPFPIFQEHIEQWYKSKIEILNEEKKKEILDVINQIVENDESYTGKHFYKLRGNFNYIVNVSKRDSE